MHHPTDRITHTTAFVTPVVEHWLEREIAQWVHPMKDRSDDLPHHERTLYLCVLDGGVQSGNGLISFCNATTSSKHTLPTEQDPASKMKIGCIQLD